jgi:triacylglycerol lipase
MRRPSSLSLVLAPVAVLAAALAGCTAGVMDVGPDGGLVDDAGRPPTQYPSAAHDAGAPRKAYPIVLAHGLDGFKNIGPLDYYFGVANALKVDGHDVWTAQVDAYNSSDARGAELQTFVLSVLAQTGAAKVNLICHSQGGLDCRYVASNLGDKVGAVVTIAAPHRGDAVADIATGVLPGPLQSAVALFLDLFGGVIDGGANNQNAQAAIQTLTSAGAADFTRRHPDDPRVAYYSIAGRSSSSSGDPDCGSATEAPFVSRWDTYVDPLNPLLAAPAAILAQSFSPTPTSDGLVTVSSAKWGIFLGCIPADHLDEVGQIGGVSPGAGNPFDHILFYRQLADWLVEQGF